MSSHNNKLYFLFVFILFSANIWGMESNSIAQMKDLETEKNYKTKLRDRENLEKSELKKEAQRLEDKKEERVQNPILVAMDKGDYSLLKDSLEKGDMPSLNMFPSSIEEIICKQNWTNVIEVWDKKGYKSLYLFAAATLFASDELFNKILEKQDKQEENFKKIFHHIAGDMRFSWSEIPENFVKRIKTLQQYGISIYARNEKGKTPLSMAFEYCRLPVAVAYLLMGADINDVKDSDLIKGTTSIQVVQSWKKDKNWNNIISLLNNGYSPYKQIIDMIRAEKNIK